MNFFFKSRRVHYKAGNSVNTNIFVQSLETFFCAVFCAVIGNVYLQQVQIKWPLRYHNTAEKNHFSKGRRLAEFHTDNKSILEILQLCHPLIIQITVSTGIHHVRTVPFWNSGMKFELGVVLAFHICEFERVLELLWASGPHQYKEGLGFRCITVLPTLYLLHWQDLERKHRKSTISLYFGHLSCPFIFIKGLVSFLTTSSKTR